MEESNVNNLNGVPNFGHGIEEDAKEEIEEDATVEEEVATPALDEEDVPADTEVVKDTKYGKRKG